MKLWEHVQPTWLRLLIRSLTYLLIWASVGAVVAGLAALLLWAPARMVNEAVPGKRDELTPEQYAKLLDDYRKTLAQALIGMGAVGTLYFSWKRSGIEQQTLEATRDSKITERFAKAIEQLGAVDKEGRKLLEIRFGGIYALERVARDSENDHWTVMEILTAYVRENTPWKEPEEASPVYEPLPPIANDIQAILTVIGRRKLAHEAGKNRKLDLTNTDLRGANLERANLSGADLRGANLEGANLSGAHLNRAQLEGVNLSEVRLNRAYLERANLGAANLEGAQLHGAHLKRAYLVFARLKGAYLYKAHLSETHLEGAHLEEANDLTREQILSAILDPRTNLPAEFQDLLPPAPASPKSTPASPPPPPAGDPADPEARA